MMDDVKDIKKHIEVFKYKIEVFKEESKSFEEVIEKIKVILHSMESVVDVCTYASKKVTNCKEVNQTWKQITILLSF